MMYLIVRDSFFLYLYDPSSLLVFIMKLAVWISVPLTFMFIIMMIDMETLTVAFLIFPICCTKSHKIFFVSAACCQWHLR